jgi:ATP-dependent DNA ligase
MEIAPVIVQRYKDGTYEEALAQGYDLVQLKYDGWNARIEIHYGWVTWYSKNERVFKKICYPNAELHAVLYAEAMYGTQWSKQPEHAEKTYVYDLFALNGTIVKGFQYRERYSLLRSIGAHLPTGFTIVPTSPISKTPELWQSEVVSGKYEGVVFKKKADTLDGTMLRQKNVFTVDLKVEDIVYSDEGKHIGLMGSLRCSDAAGASTDVGGGFEDTERAAIARSWPASRGRTLEAEVRGRFESGAYRHANFIRWRDDKS